MNYDTSHVSDVVIRRLPQYYRHLESLERSGVTRISSKELGAQMGLTASQIRQDINFFGTFGQQGYGYNVRDLKDHLAGILGLNKGYNMIVVGMGSIGHAIVNYQSFKKRGFNFTALFDNAPSLVGRTVSDIEIKNIIELKSFLSKNRVDIAAICTPSDAAQDIADTLIEGGVSAIWNFAPVSLNVPSDIALNNVHLTDSLLFLSYKLSHK
ncbi:MAG: redox-sensing transcriptional repressor Rex [Clostridia bacterium]|nr:redox-sensing transcriptional repressor Rex [Clostridia bacterium]